jgi:hypothetical protein
MRWPPVLRKEDPVGMGCHNCGAPIESLSEYFGGVTQDPNAPFGSGRCFVLCHACVMDHAVPGTRIAVAARSAGWSQPQPRTRRTFTARDETGRVLHG